MMDNKDIEQEEKTIEESIQDDLSMENVSEEKSEDVEKTVELQLAEAQEEIAKLNDQLLRKIAEFENYRKRTIKEKTELILNGGQKVLESLLPVLDDLERAQANIGKSTDVFRLSAKTEEA